MLCMHIPVCIHIPVCLHMTVCMYVCMYVWWIEVCTSMSVCMYLCISYSENSWWWMELLCLSYSRLFQGHEFVRTLRTHRPPTDPRFQSSWKWQEIGQKVPKSYFCHFSPIFGLFWSLQCFLSRRGSRCSLKANCRNASNKCWDLSPSTP